MTPAVELLAPIPAGMVPFAAPWDPLSSFVQTVATGVLPSVLRAAADLLFQTPDLSGIAEIQGLTRTVLLVADSLLVLFLTYLGARIITTGGSDARYELKAVLPRVLAGAVAANLSLLICSTLIHLNNGLITGILGPDPAQSGWSALAGRLQSGNLSGALVDSLVALAGGLLAVVLTVIYLLRDLLLVFLTVAAPICLMCHGVPELAGIATSWWRAYCAAVFMQVGHGLLIAVGADLLAHPDWLGTASSPLITGLLIVALFYAMVRLPFVIYQFAFGHAVTQHPALVRVVTIVKSAAKTAATAAAV